MLNSFATIHSFEWRLPANTLLCDKNLLQVAFERSLLEWEINHIEICEDVAFGQKSLKRW
jgi:hypothetical protein